jgi:GNAT superfamily N-acetyltransferase
VDIGTTGSGTEAIRLFDGTGAQVRPIRPDDADALQRFHSHLSPSTVRRRFFTFHPVLSPHEVERFTNVDGTDRYALVVECGTEIVAVGRYDRMERGDTAEVAFVVADALQHHGLGSLLFARLVRRAREVGITTFYAETLEGNASMLGVFGDSGCPMRTATSMGVVDVHLDISPGDPPGEAG